MTNQTNVEEIEEALDKVCDMMPDSVKDQCKHLIETYEPAIAEILSRDVDPKEVCTIMKLCDDAQANLLMSQVQDSNPVKEIKKAEDNCALCTYVINTIFGMLENKDDQDEVKNALETVCRIMPGKS